MSELYETMSDEENEEANKYKVMDLKVLDISYKIQSKQQIKTKYELLIKKINEEIVILKKEERDIHKTYKKYFV